MSAGSDQLSLLEAPVITRASAPAASSNGAAKLLFMRGAQR